MSNDGRKTCKQNCRTKRPGIETDRQVKVVVVGDVMIEFVNRHVTHV